MSFWESFWDIAGLFVMGLIFAAYLVALFSIISDLFRDRELNGWAKAAWLLFLVFFPYVPALVYLIARGKGMGDRAAKQAQEVQTAQEDYIRQVAGGPAGEIEAAHKLLTSGAITQDEFEQLKAKALA